MAANLASGGKMFHRSGVRAEKALFLDSASLAKKDTLVNGIESAKRVKKNEDGCITRTSAISASYPGLNPLRKWYR